jgi:two-component system chemotaxis response regulator CheY
MRSEREPSYPIDRAQHVPEQYLKRFCLKGVGEQRGTLLIARDLRRRVRCDGADALGKLNGRKVNLIISDLNMPKMDGLTLLEEVKKRPAYKFTPFVLLTTETDPSKRERAKAAGAKAWVVKPFQPQQMLDAVAKLVLP